MIADEEVIARGAYDPSHGEARRRKITNQLIRKDDLIDGECSVWRMDPPGLALDSLVIRLEQIKADPLFAVTAATAAKIRSIDFAAGGRAFCVVDECECDAAGNKHPAHAHIALCSGLRMFGVTKDDPNFIQAHRDLALLLKGNVVWNVLPSRLAA